MEIVIVLALLFPAQLPFSSSASSTRAPTVNTTYGPVSGVVEDLSTNKTVKRYLGIPFAKAKRLENPLSPEMWTSIHHADGVNTTCPQGMSDPRISENCLLLSLYIPVRYVSGSARLPVMLWVHGGSFMIGDTLDYDGSVLATEGEVIVVTAAYRLGALGFLSTNSDDLKGNYGMMDLIEALKWVNKNIARFGGDPSKVTIFGFSAGAMGIGLMMLSPLASGLYQNVIMQSGTAAMLFAALEKDEAYARASAFAKAVGCENLDSLKECLKKKTLHQILMAQHLVPRERGLAIFGPVVDGVFLQDSPLKLLQEGKFNKTNVLLGFTREDGSPFISVFTEAVANVSQGIPSKAFKTGTQKMSWVRKQNSHHIEAVLYQYTDWLHVNDPYATLQQSIDVVTDANFKAPVVLSADAFIRKESSTYMYQFEEEPKEPSWYGVSHGDDIIYTFGEPLIAHSNNSVPADIQLSKDIIRFWTNFAKTGNPNKPLPIRTNWPQYTADKQEYMGLSRNLTVKSKLRATEMAFWNEFMPKLTENGTVSQTHKEKTNQDSKGQVVLVLAVLTGVFAGLFIILLVFLISRFYFSKHNGRDLLSSFVI